MYEFPKDFDLNIFVGKSTLNVVFSSNTVDFNFEGDLSITVLGSFAHEFGTRGEEHLFIESGPPLRFSCAMQLANAVVTAAQVDTDGTLVLNFDNDQTLRCYNETDQYECYWINAPGRQVII